MTDKPPDKPDTTSEKKRERGFDIFISHASEDTELARSLRDALSGRGVKCWFDDEDLKPGENWSQTLREAIDRSQMCLLVLSKASVASKPWISREWSLIQSSAWERDNLAILPVLLDRVEAPTFLRRWNSLRCDSRRTNVERLAAEIAARLSSAQSNQEKGLTKRDRAEAAERFRNILGALERAESSERTEKDKDSDE